jgi:hypothetical protein
MHSIKFKKRVGADGILHLDIPIDSPDKEVEIMVIYQPTGLDSVRRTAT